MAHINFYFDFISPYAYLAAKRLHELEMLGHNVSLKPVLFAGFLNHHGQKGPAEIEPKRTHTYRQFLWQARALGLSVRLPTGHPFNPMPLLRLQLALGNTKESMHALFDYVWRDGLIPTDAAFETLISHHGLLDRAAINTPEVKAALRANGEEALALGLFGVPSFIVEGSRGHDGKPESFWGEDSIDMLKAYLAGDRFFASSEVKRVYSLPVAVSRV